MEFRFSRVNRVHKESKLWLKCFHCLSSPTGDDPILIGINILVSKGLAEHESDPPQYPCYIVNRFQCHYERTNNREGANVKSTDSHFDVEDL
jgi:hypothetical protein